MKKFELPQCPYCGEQIWYIEAFLAKNRKTYKCKSCKKICKTDVSNRAFKILGIAEIIEVLIFIAAIFAGGTFCLAGAGIIMLIFLAVYSILPFTLQLFKLRKRTENDEDVFMSMKKESGRDTDTEIYSN